MEHEPASWAGGTWRLACTKRVRPLAEPGPLVGDHDPWSAQRAPDLDPDLVLNRRFPKRFRLLLTPGTRFARSTPKGSGARSRSVALREPSVQDQVSEARSRGQNDPEGVLVQVTGHVQWSCSKQSMKLALDNCQRSWSVNEVGQYIFLFLKNL